MQQGIRNRFAAILVAMTMGVTASVGAERRPLDDAVWDHIDALERKVESLEAELGRDWLTEKRAAEIRALAADVLADADTRASMLQFPAPAGYDNNFYLCSGDNSFRLAFSGALQFNYIYAHQNDPPDGDEHRGGFQLKRTSLVFFGHVGDPSWKYVIHGVFLGAGDLGGSLEIVDAYIEKHFDNGLAITAGQFRLPFGREFLTSYMRQQTFDRSLVTWAMGPGRSHGVQLGFEVEDVRGKVMISDGQGPPAGPRGSDAAWFDRDTEWAITARSGVKLAGQWKQFTDQQSWPEEELAVLIGGAVHLESGEYGTNDFETDVFKWTADCTLELGGANLFAAVYGSYDDSNDPAVADRDMYAFQIQGGVFVTDDIDVYARYEWGDDDTDADDLSVLTVGFNRYWYRHNLKFTADVGYAFNGVGETWQKSLLGWRADTAGEDGQVVVRTQLQLVY